MKAIRTRVFLHTLFAVTLSLSSLHAASASSPRIPAAYFVTTGTGESDLGTPPDPYRAFSYDIALFNAGIGNVNVVLYAASVLPPDAREVPIVSVRERFRHGALLEAVIAKAGGKQGDTAAAGIGRVWAVNAEGEPIGGFVAEYERIYLQKYVDPEKARADAVKQLTASLKHQLSIRGLRQVGEMKFDIVSLSVRKNYGVAFAALCFVNFIYPDALPLGSGKE